MLDKAAISNHINSILLDISRLKETVPARTEFRCSSLPYCPIRTAFLEKGEESFSKSFYVEIGTAVHKVVQHWMPKGRYRKDLFGVWKCPKCRKEHGPSHPPIKCEGCGGKELVYEEITLKYRNLSGHVDMITHIGNGRYVLWDFKTTDLVAKRKRGHISKFKPSPNYFIQIRTYATLLRKLYGINIVAWTLVFIDRAKPIQALSDYHKIVRPWKKKNHAHQIRLIDAACDNNERYKKFIDALNASTEYNPKAVKALKQMVLHRPCKTEKTYDEWMGYGFYKGECELKGPCLTSNKAAYRRIQELL